MSIPIDYEKVIVHIEACQHTSGHIRKLLEIYKLEDHTRIIAEYIKYSVASDMTMFGSSNDDRANAPFVEQNIKAMSHEMLTLVARLMILKVREKQLSEQKTVTITIPKMDSPYIPDFMDSPPVPDFIAPIWND